VQCVDAFVDELRWEEMDLAKREKIRELKLTSEEWERVHLFLSLLNVRHLFCIRRQA
jgi:MoaA/NifB/PqqE/SkfB family radical SAM enzyme